MLYTTTADHPAATLARALAGTPGIAGATVSVETSGAVVRVTFTDGRILLILDEHGARFGDVSGVIGWLAALYDTQEDVDNLEFTNQFGSEDYDDLAALIRKTASASADYADLV